MGKAKGGLTKAYNSHEFARSVGEKIYGIKAIVFVRMIKKNPPFFSPWFFPHQIFHVKKIVASFTSTYVTH